MNDFFEAEKKVHIAIIGMGGACVFRTLHETIYEIPEGTSLEEVKKILGGYDVDCPLCEQGLPVKETKYVCLDGVGNSAILIDEGSDLHKLIEGKSQSMEMIPQPIEKFQSLRDKKRNDIPKPYQRKGKYRHGWK